MLLGFGSGASDLRTVVEGYQMTAQGLRKLGGGETQRGGQQDAGLGRPSGRGRRDRKPDSGRIVAGGAKAYWEASGSSTIEGRAKATADEIAAQLKMAAEKAGGGYLQPREAPGQASSREGQGRSPGMAWPALTKERLPHAVG